MSTQTSRALIIRTPTNRNSSLVPVAARSRGRSFGQRSCTGPGSAWGPNASDSRDPVGFSCRSAGSLAAYSAYIYGTYIAHIHIYIMYMYIIYIYIYIYLLCIHMTFRGFDFERLCKGLSDLTWKVCSP